MPFDALNPTDLVLDELRQLSETGYPTGPLYDWASQLDGLNLSSAYEHLAEFQDLQRGADWSYDEPSDLAAILAALPKSSDGSRALGSDYEDRLLGAWTGRIIGCMLGKPIEDGVFWTAARIREYLQLADALPLRDYIPALDPMPAGYELKPCWTETTRGRVHGSARDDDIDYTIINLGVLEACGADFDTGDVAAAWLARLPILQVYTAERAAYRNLIDGLEPPLTASTYNPYREWIGAQIRADVFGYISPGQPRRAALLAYRDAVLSHTANGIYGEMWAAALIATALQSEDPADCLTESLRHVPPRSRLSEGLEAVLEQRRLGVSWEQCLRHIQATVGHYPWVHAVSNSCLVAAALLWGGGEYLKTVALTVQGGWDTDSNGATAGSVMGALLGSRAIPRHMADPIGDHVRSAVFGVNSGSIADLARRTAALGRGFAGGS
jgi:ADP-ribosylglycohydrolase